MLKTKGIGVVVVIAAVAFTGCESLDQMTKDADLTGCRKFASTETRDAKEAQVIINQCMANEGHVGFDVRMIDK